MKRYLTILLITATMFLAASVLPEEEDDIVLRHIPNSCGISATEAYERIYATGAWVRMIAVHFTLPSGMVVGHMMVVWQPHRSKGILVFDEAVIRSTVDLPDAKRNADSIKDALNKLLVGITITDARFIQP